jgi:glyoxylase-like metal-dependent hydrolase (beta-lactamase superfamily II)
MDDGWFTVEGIDPSTYAISEYGHWERPHSYLVLGQERAALIDSGLGVGNIKAVVERLTSLPVAVLTTHSHWDHIGGHDLFADIAVHRLDARWLEHGIPTPLENQRATFMKEPLETQPPAGFALETWCSPRVRPTRLLEDQDKVALGGRSLEILHTPGHSPGHICIHDRVTGYLFTGDLVYSGTLHASYESTDPEAFASSVDRLCELEGVTRVLPGHNVLELDRSALLKVRDAFADLEVRGLLRHGTGLHDFGFVKIHL